VCVVEGFPNKRYILGACGPRTPAGELAYQHCLWLVVIILQVSE
jgi:hypothetical protein